MKSILISNLSISKDVITCAHLIEAYKKENSSSQITLLVYKEQEKYARMIKGVSHIVTVDSQYIQSLVKNPLYSDAFAINSFSKELGTIINTDWDIAFNYSNDKVSAYLLSAINVNNKKGCFIDAEGVSRTSDNWATYLNYVSANNTTDWIQSTKVKNHIMSVPMRSDINKIIINEDYLFAANQNLNRIKKMDNKNAKFIIALNLEVGYDGYGLSLKNLEEIVEALEETAEYKVVLLTSGKSYQKEIVNNLNEKFNNRLVSINVKSEGVPAVITSLDMLISAANDQLMIADTLDVKTVELRDFRENRAPICTNANNYLIRVKDSNLIASDVLLAINEEFKTELPVSTLNSVNPTYLTIEDELGVYKTQIRGEMDLLSELDYHIGRMVHFEMMGFAISVDFLGHIKKSVSLENRKLYSAKVKQELTMAVKHLLNSLRALKGAQTSQQQLNSFIDSLGLLIQAGEEKTLVSSMIKMFEGRIENITEKEAKQNFKKIEEYLFILKSDMQIISNYLDQLLEQEKVESTISIAP